MNKKEFILKTLKIIKKDLEKIIKEDDIFDEATEKMSTYLMEKFITR